MRAAVIGAGHIAKQHLGALRALPEVEVVGVCDLSPATAEAAAERFGVGAWFTDSGKMLTEGRPDVVHVCTPLPSHAALCRQALDAGAHVLVEKPATATAAELEELLEFARARGRMLIENYNYLYNAQPRRIIDMIGTQEFGDVVHVEVFIALNILDPSNPFSDPNVPNPLLKVPGGAIGDFLPHLVSLAHAFAGPAREVKAVWSKRSSTVLPSDEFQGVAVCERGTASLGFSAHAQPDLFWLRVHGTRARASASLFETYLNIERVRGGPKPLVPFHNARDESRAARRGAYGGLWRKLGGGPASYEGLWELVRRFYASAAGRETPPVTPGQMLEINRWSDGLKREDATACACS